MKPIIETYKAGEYLVPGSLVYLAVRGWRLRVLDNLTTWPKLQTWLWHRWARMYACKAIDRPFSNVIGCSLDQERVLRRGGFTIE
jgi:hypothetical protein